jgi:hypothetical protein
MGEVKLRAKIFHGQVHCGRDGCTGGPFGGIVEVGRNSRGPVYSFEPTGDRWVRRPDLVPDRWVRGRHSRRCDRIEAEDPGRTGQARLLPLNMECPDCHAIQQVVPPSAIG